MFSVMSALAGFNRRFWRRSDRCSAAISAVNNCAGSRKVADLLGYVPLYTYTIPLRAARQSHPALPPLRIRGQGSRPRSSLSDEVSDLFEGTSAELQRLLEEAEGESSSSSSSESSFSSWDIDLGAEDPDEEAEVEDGEEVDQVPVAAQLIPVPLVQVPDHINLPSSDSDIAIIEPREVVEHSYSHSSVSTSELQGNEEIMAPKVRVLGKKQVPRTEPPLHPEAPGPVAPVVTEDQSMAPSSMAGGKRKGKQPAEGASRQKRGKGVGSTGGSPELWTPQFTAVELGKHVTSADSTKDHETCVALGNAMMLPQDVADHAAESAAEFGGKLVMLGAQVSTFTFLVFQTNLDV